MTSLDIVVLVLGVLWFAGLVGGLWCLFAWPSIRQIGQHVEEDRAVWEYHCELEASGYKAKDDLAA